MRTWFIGSFIAGCFLFFANPASSQVHQWSKNFGDESGSITRAICSDSQGNVIIGGSVVGNVDFGGGVLPAGAYVAKLNAQGEHQWSATYSATGSTIIVNGVAADGLGNVYAAGYFYGSVDFGGGNLAVSPTSGAFLAKFDADGNHKWSHAYGGDHTVAWDVAASPDGRVAIAGDTQGTLDFGGGSLVAQGQDAFVACFDGTGDLLFGHLFGDAADQSCDAVGMDADGNVVIGGLCKGTIDFGSGPLTTNGTQFSDAFLAKFSSAGAHIWSALYGDASAQYTQSVECDETGQILVTGHTSGSVDLGGGTLGSGYVFAAKFASDGSHLWSRAYNGDGVEYGLWATPKLGGECVLSGYAAGSIDFGTGVLSPVGYGNKLFVVARLDAMGNAIWSRGYEASVLVNGRAACDAQGGIYVDGDFWPQIDLGGDPLTVAGGASGGSDIFLARFSPDQIPTTQVHFGGLKSRFRPRP